MKLFNQKIENIDISDIESITLIIKGWWKIEIESDNFYKIVSFIIENTKKRKFIENELKYIYNYIIQNYETQLDKDDFDDIKEKLFTFVQNWWSVFIKYKLTLKKFILWIWITFWLAIIYIWIISFINISLLNIFWLDNIALPLEYTEEMYNEYIKKYYFKGSVEDILWALFIISFFLFPFHINKLNQKYKIPTKFAWNLLLILVIIGIFSFCWWMTIHY